MRHFASPAYWNAYSKLPEPVRELADKNYALLTFDHVTRRYISSESAVSGQCVSDFVIALGHGYREGLLWFWIAHMPNTIG